MMILLSLLVAAAAATQPRPFTLDDEMKMRAIVDVRIAPDGERVAYVVSTPNLTRDEHEAALYVVSSAGGAPTRFGESIRILNTPLPSPRMRWSPDSNTLALLGLAGERPQVFAIPFSYAATTDRCARGGLRLRMVARWKERRLSDARSDAG
jgi:Tol biopolymer transport system component